MNKIRQPAVAGLFYPADPGRLRGMVQEFLDTAVSSPTPLNPKAIIAPHAGYVYSGPIAGSAFSPWHGQMANVNRIILIGPAHTMAVSGLAGVSVGAFSTPLGEVLVDEEAMETLRPLPQVQIHDGAHGREHCLEVMLPFLQLIAPQAKIVPLVVGQSHGREVAELLEVLWGGPETRIVISSDLSHYNDYHTAQRLDAATAQAIETLQPDKLGSESACGRIAIQGLLYQAQIHHLTAHTIDLRNSGDTAGSHDRVVGYGAFLFA
ncbi:MAG TPA: AmmeMemoRadiSam system protein B [Chloroflexota bacterium]|nr:AmmeMemoRadiSam system protein B [Chloroflexota bacterium]HUM69674.1 AmmeMemoRadiSam system protein B [Chloroflexota bacterium]